MKKVLFDSDVLLDFFLVRQPFVADATQLWTAVAQNKIEGYVSGITPVNVFYMVKKLRDASSAKTSVELLLDAFKVCVVDTDILQAARTSAITDFEDAVQHAAAVNSGLDAIVTRNISDYKKGTLTLYTPAQLLKKLP